MARRSVEHEESYLTDIYLIGYKSFARGSTIDLRGLTLLAGANSSGKSSALQPLLLLKQTLESSSDHGALKIDGPLVKYKNCAEMFWRGRVGSDEPSRFAVSLGRSGGSRIRLEFILPDERFWGSASLVLDKMYFRDEDGDDFKFSEDMSVEDIQDNMPDHLMQFAKTLFKSRASSDEALPSLSWNIVRRACFLGIEASDNKSEDVWSPFISPAGLFERIISNIIYVPGLRGNPERSYPVRGVFGNGRYPGLFQDYVASLLSDWDKKGDSRFEDVNKLLYRLGLSSGLVADKDSDTSVEILVGRSASKLWTNSGLDVVNIADVGLGVSQALVVLMALVAASPGQLVIIEQPELHLHPNAQHELGKILAEFAMRGIRLVVETHSRIMLLAIQAEVASGRVNSDLVGLNWFQRDEDGGSVLRSQVMSEHGGLGDWPYDFDSVSLSAEREYLKAARDSKKQKDSMEQ